MRSRFLNALVISELPENGDWIDVPAVETALEESYSRPTVRRALRTLRREGWIAYEENHPGGPRCRLLAAG